MGVFKKENKLKKMKKLVKKLQYNNPKLAKKVEGKIAYIKGMK